MFCKRPETLCSCSARQFEVFSRGEISLFAAGQNFTPANDYKRFTNRKRRQETRALLGMAPLQRINDLMSAYSRTPDYPRIKFAMMFFEDVPLLKYLTIVEDACIRRITYYGRLFVTCLSRPDPKVTFNSISDIKHFSYIA